MAHFTPQEIEQFLQEFFDVVGTRQYTGARYIPIFGRKGEDSIEWNNFAPYEPLTVVMYQGVSYVSKQYVPKDIDILDTRYWAETYRFNAQVEQYRQEVLNYEDDLANKVPFPNSDVYSKYGTLGQVLTTLSDGTTKWENPVVPSDAQAEEIITAWLNDHPEATTTVQNNSITTAKLRDACVTNPKITDDTIADEKLVQNGGVLDRVSDLTSQLSGMVERTYNLLDMNSAKWHAASGKDVTLSNIDSDTIRIVSNISQTYASAYYAFDTRGISTLYTRLGSYAGTGTTSARLFGGEPNHGTVVGTINLTGNLFDVSTYDKCYVIIYATMATAGTVYSDYHNLLVAASEEALPYVPYYNYKIDDVEDDVEALTTRVDNIEQELNGNGLFYAIHRGARNTAPENTMPAFILARQLGYNIIETDVRFTSDNVAVLLHDGTINRTARNADGTVIQNDVAIADITYAQALTYDFGIAKGQQYAGTKIPTLAEFLMWCKLTNITPVLEQKIRDNAKMDIVIAELLTSETENQCAILSQTIGSLNYIHNRIPNGRYILLNTGNPTNAEIDSVASSGYVEAVMGNYQNITAETATYCDSKNVALYANTFNAFSDIYSANNYISGYLVEEGAM